MLKQELTELSFPTNLKHKPVVGVNEYWKIDGPYAGNTDATGITLGLSTCDSEDISAKVWRRSEEKWKRSSEELPLHRVLDLTILILETLKKGTKRERLFIHRGVCTEGASYL